MKRTHGQSGTPTYMVWKAMMQRCYLAASPHVTRRYRDRGISVCVRWHDFLNFIADMGVRPDGMTLDRIDNDGHYDPSNCRWATRKEQARNRSGRTRSLDEARAMVAAVQAGGSRRELAERFGVTKGMIGHIRHGRAWAHLCEQSK